jgi:hypothetical protein
MNTAERARLVNEVSRNTVKLRISDWARNIVHNEKKIRRGKNIRPLFKKMRGLPAIIVGTGPSLDKNIKLLPEVKNKALIIAVDSATKPIIDLGIIPDMIFIADSKERVVEFFENINSLKDVFVCVDSFVHPKVIKRLEELSADIRWYSVFPNEQSVFCQSVAKDFTGDIGFLGSGGCVTSIAYSFATGGLQCDPITIIGVDSGYYNPTNHHSSTVLERTEKFQFREELVEDIYGNPIITNGTLRTYCIWMEDTALSNQTNGLFINATEGGIISRGWVVMPLRVVITRYFKSVYNFREILLGDSDEKKNSSNGSVKKKQTAKKQESKEDKKSAVVSLPDKSSKK